MRLRRSAVFLGLLLLAGWASAEVVVLRDGRRIVGSCRANEKDVIITRGMLIQYIQRPMVERVELEPRQVEELDALKRRLESGGAKGLFELAEWLDDRLQFVEAEVCYRKVLDASPDHKGARAALGYRKVNGEWRADPIKQVERALKGFGSSAAKRLADLARASQEAGDAKVAERAWRQVLVRDPYHAEGLKAVKAILADYRTKNRYRKPVDGKWIAVSGHHHENCAYMLHAIDLSKADDDGRLSAGSKLEDWYSWDAEVHAAAAGKVFAVTDGFDDSPVGRPGDFLQANSVCIDHGDGEFTLYAHLKKGSIVVRKGERVKAGDLVGRVGNSGSSGTPHLHFCVYDRDGISVPFRFEDDKGKGDATKP